jgi:hypothetical protein
MTMEIRWSRICLFCSSGYHTCRPTCSINQTERGFGRADPDAADDAVGQICLFCSSGYHTRRPTCSINQTERGFGRADPDAADDAVGDARRGLAGLAKSMRFRCAEIRPGQRPYLGPREQRRVTDDLISTVRPWSRPRPPSVTRRAMSTGDRISAGPPPPTS